MPEPEPEPELELELEPEAELVEAGGFDAGALDSVEPPAVPGPLSGALAGAGVLAGAACCCGAGLDEDLLLGSHLPPAQIACQSRS